MYAANLKTIQESNARNGGFTLEVNGFADLTWEEFKADWLGASGQETCSATGNHVRNGLTPPAAIDWRDKVRALVRPVGVSCAYKATERRWSDGVEDQRAEEAFMDPRQNRFVRFGS